MANIAGFNGKGLEYVGQVQFVAGKGGFVELPADRVIKDIHFMIGGVATPTFSAGTPKVRKYGMGDGLIRSVKVERSGGDALRTYLGVRQIVNDMLWFSGERGPVLSKVNASSLGLAVSSDSVTFGTSTQPVPFYEGYAISMENKKSSEYWRTYFSTLNNRSAKVIFEFGQGLDVLDPEDTSTTSAIAISDCFIDVYISTADQLLPASDSFEDNKTSYDQIILTGPANASRYTIQPEGELQGFWITMAKGVKQADLTHEELQKSFIEIKFDGATIVKGKMLDIAAINMNHGKMHDLIRSSCYIGLLNNSTWGTGLVTGEGSSVKSLEVFITTPAMDYTGGVRLIFEYDRVGIRKRAEAAKKA